MNRHLVDGLGMEINSLPSPPDARGSADIIYRLWRISLLCGSDIVNDVTK